MNERASWNAVNGERNERQNESVSEQNEWIEKWMNGIINENRGYEQNEQPNQLSCEGSFKTPCMTP